MLLVICFASLITHVILCVHLWFKKVIGGFLTSCHWSLYASLFILIE